MLTNIQTESELTGLVWSWAVMNKITVIGYNPGKWSCKNRLACLCTRPRDIKSKRTFHACLMLEFYCVAKRWSDGIDEGTLKLIERFLLL